MWIGTRSHDPVLGRSSIPLGFLPALLLIDEGKVICYRDAGVLKSWKDHVEGKNLNIALDDLRVITVDAVPKNNPGLSHDPVVSHRKILALESLGDNTTNVQLVHIGH